ncbi:hypothetical protein D3C81_1797400 [compost metagenome]
MAASATCSLSWLRNSHSPLVKLFAARRATIRMPKTVFSASSGAMTRARSPPCARRCGNGNATPAMSASYTSLPRTQLDRPFSSMGICACSLIMNDCASTSLRTPTHVTCSACCDGSYRQMQLKSMGSCSSRLRTTT